MGTYNPSIHTASNKPYGTRGKSDSARSYYYDETSYSYRPFLSIQEVFDYFTNPNDRIGHFSIFVNDGANIKEYWFKDGVENADLIEKASETIADITADVTVGAIDRNDIIPSGTNIQELTELIFNKTYYPTYINPSFSLSNNAGLREIGELADFTATFNFNRGSIVLQSITQNPRAGVASSFTINQITQPSNVLNITDYPVIQGYNTIQGTVTYETGFQPFDSKVNPYDSPYPAGTSPVQSTWFEGVYPLFATISTLVNPNKLPLYSMLTGNNIVMDLIAEINGNKQFFEIPLVWLQNRPLQSVQYFNPVSNQYDTSNKLIDFETTNTVNIIMGENIDYVRYTNISPDRGTIKIKLIF